MIIQYEYNDTNPLMQTVFLVRYVPRGGYQSSEEGSGGGTITAPPEQPKL